MKKIGHFLKSFSLGGLLVSLICVIVGVSLLLWGDLSSEIVCRVFGVVLCANALVQLILSFGNDEYASRRSLLLFASLIMAVIGVWMALKAPSAITDRIIFVILSVILLYHGLFYMKCGLDLRNAGYKLWFVALLLGIFLLAGGVLSLIWYEKSWLRVAVGCGFIFDGLSGFWVFWTIAAVKRRAALYPEPDKSSVEPIKD